MWTATKKAARKKALDEEFKPEELKRLSAGVSNGGYHYRQFKSDLGLGGVFSRNRCNLHRLRLRQFKRRKVSSIAKWATRSTPPPVVQSLTCPYPCSYRCLMSEGSRGRPSRLPACNGSTVARLGPNVWFRSSCLPSRMRVKSAPESNPSLRRSQRGAPYRRSTKKRE